MQPNTSIHYLTRKEIDIEKWNECIEKADNGLIYSYSFYLDAVCDNWGAFVFDDYKAVLPLPWKKKGWIKYLCAVPFIQQLGITGKNELINYQNLLEEIKKKFKYGDIFFNSGNSLPFTVKEKTNFILELNKPFDSIAARFSNDLKQNLKGKNKKDFFLFNDQPFGLAINLFKKSYQHRIRQVSEKEYQKFSSLCNYLWDKNMLLTRCVKNNEKEILAIALLFIDNKRIYNLMNTTTPKGRNARANHFLLSEILKEFSGNNLVFDFEGSDLPGVKDFYENFAPVNQPYFHFHFNNLPFPLNLVKK